MPQMRTSIPDLIDDGTTRADPFDRAIDFGAGFIAPSTGVDDDHPDPQFSRDPVKWTEQTRVLKGAPFSFADRDYLPPIYRDTTPEICVVKGRQTEMTEFVTNLIGYNAYTYPYTVHTYISNIWENSKVFSDYRMGDLAIRSSPIWDRYVASEDAHFAHQTTFRSGSKCYYLSAQNQYVTARSKPADFLYLDECQSHELEYVDVATEGLSHSKHGRAYYIGTGSYEDTAWWRKWHSGTQHKWDAEAGAWVVVGAGDDAQHVHSYHIPQTIVPWITAEQIERKRRAALSENVFVMEVMGWWVRGVTKPITTAMLRSNYDHNASFIDPGDIDHSLGPVFVGVDWGGGTRAHTVVWITQLLDDGAAPLFAVRSATMINDSDVELQADRVISIIQDADPDLGVMDQGGGMRQVQKVEDRYTDLIHKCVYHTDMQEPLKMDKLPTDNLIKANRTNAIDGVIDLLRMPHMLSDAGEGSIPRYVIPASDAKPLAWIESHFTAIFARAMRSQSGQEYIKYDHEPGHATDALHAATYAHMAYQVWQYWHQRGAATYVGDMA